MLLARLERMLGHTLESEGQSFVVGRIVVLLSAVDVRNACQHRLERTLKDVLMTVRQEVEFVERGCGRRGRGRWLRRRSGGRLWIDWSVAEWVR